MAMVVTNATKRAVGYFRVSTTKQAGERHSSLETQNGHFQDYCRYNNLRQVATYTDIVTGKRDDRKEYHCMLRFVLEDGADVVVVQFLDRFGRNPREILRRYWELEENGVKVVATDEEISEELILLVKAGMAGAESRRTSERVRANMSRSVAKGIHAARPPYGLRPIREINQGTMTVRWEIDSEEGPIVKEMVRMAIEENLGYKSIGDRLTEKGYRARGSRPFAAYTIQQILKNPAIMGTLVYGRKPRKGNPVVQETVVPEFFPPIITEDVWQRLQDRLNIRRETPRGQAHASVYILSGIARCGHCGGPMSGKVGATYNGKRYRNYYCSRAMHSRELCSFYNGHSTAKLEKAILEYLGQFSDPQLVAQYLTATDREKIKEKEAQLQEIERKLSVSENGFIKRLDDLLKREILSEEEFDRANKAERENNSKLEKTQKELKAWLEKERDRTTLAEKLPQTISTFLKTFQGMDIRQQKAQLQTILRAAHVFSDGRIGLEFRD
jgi:site-specific DNA recombinase